MRDFPALFASYWSPGNVTALCILNISSVLFACVCLLLVAVWRSAAIVFLFESCVSKITFVLLNSEVFACLPAWIYPTVQKRRSGTEICPIEDCGELSELIIFPYKFTLICLRRSYLPGPLFTQSLLYALAPTPTLKRHYQLYLCLFCAAFGSIHSWFQGRSWMFYKADLHIVLVFSNKGRLRTLPRHLDYNPTKLFLSSSDKFVI